MQLEDRIGQDITKAELRERRPDAQDCDPSGVAGAAQNEAANHDVVAGPDEAASADISQLRGRCVVGIVYLEQANAGGLVPASESGGVSARLKVGHDDRLEIVAWLKERALDERTLRVLPVIVRRDERAVRATQVKERIGQDITQTYGYEGRPETSDDYGLACVTGDDEAADHGVIAGIHLKPG